MLYSDLIELKTQFDIDPLDSSEDKLILFFLSQVSSWFDEILDYPDIEKKVRTQFYGGSGTQNLLLKNRPVFVSGLQVWEDEQGYFGAASDSFSSSSLLEYGKDYALRLDGKEEGTSRSGILIRIGNWWPRPVCRQGGFLSPFVGQSAGNVKVTYTAGYTPDSLPDVLRSACAMLVGRLRYIFPLGVELNSDGYEERNVGIVTSQKNKLLDTVRPILFNFRNWSW